MATSGSLPLPPRDLRSLRSTSLSPRGEDHREVASVGHAVLIEVRASGATPACQENRQITAPDLAIVVEVSGTDRVAGGQCALQQGLLRARRVPAHFAAEGLLQAHQFTTCFVGAERGGVGFVVRVS